MIQGRQKMKNGLYPFFWQHGEEHAILSEYMDKIAESGMKGVCIEARHIRTSLEISGGVIWI